MSLYFIWTNWQQHYIKSKPNRNNPSPTASSFFWRVIVSQVVTIPIAIFTKSNIAFKWRKTKIYSHVVYTPLEKNCCILWENLRNLLILKWRLLCSSQLMFLAVQFRFIHIEEKKCIDIKERTGVCWNLSAIDVEFVQTDNRDIRMIGTQQDASNVFRKIYSFHALCIWYHKDHVIFHWKMYSVYW